MSRFLHRPMFRRGGSTGEGITSGLRQGYAHSHPGTTVQPPRDSSAADFWLNFGTNILAQPGGRPILQTLGTASKQPLAQYQQSRAAKEKMDWERGLHEEEMNLKRAEIATQKEQFTQTLEQDKYLGELAAKGKDEFKTDIINQVWDARVKDAPSSEHAEMEKQRLDDIYRYVAQGEDVSDQFKVLTTESAVSMAQGLAEDAIVKLINPDTKIKWTTEDAGYEEFLLKLYKRYLKTTSEFLRDEEKELELDAAGGRVGRALGGMTEDVNVMAETPGGISDINVSETMERDPGETNEINISYEQLRDRLPPEISNEIVLLLSESYEAFADFAEIQTQADVNEFNTKYNVQLFLPQQSGV